MIYMTTIILLLIAFMVICLLYFDSSYYVLCRLSLCVFFVHIYVPYYFFLFLFFNQKTAYDMRISDWSSDVCSSDLIGVAADLEELRLRGVNHINNGEIDLNLAQLPRDHHLIAFVGGGIEGFGAGRLRLLDQDVEVLGSLGEFLEHGEIGIASCRDRVCRSGYISVVAGVLKKN